jgi:two-component system alkaline phosphatase synthesis response regulator PhoP
MKKNIISQTGAWAGAPLQRQPNLCQRILVVDDDPLIRQLNSEVLIYSGYQADTAKDGAAAWEALYASNYDLLITGNNMPKVSGVDLLKKIHATRLALPVIMATGTLPAWEFSRSPWLQPAAVLLKPYTFDELLGTVREVLRVTADVRNEIAPPNWQGQPSPDGQRL